MICETCQATIKRRDSHLKGHSLETCKTTQQAALGNIETHNAPVEIYGVKPQYFNIRFRRGGWGRPSRYNQVEFAPEWAVLLYKAELDWVLELVRDSKESAHGKAAWVAMGCPLGYSFYRLRGYYVRDEVEDD